ncbi:hypothetical protein CRM22_008368 [Opisthorchis felineus]|uniref:UPF0506 domain-containing protein n=1 Tax=Opisthorchis felineus TaxID=147828 RepID=A0A4S2LDP3_OPIFE|nr:hypothetical protein CRM22_008368 [Opisthorchis felineus]
MHPWILPLFSLTITFSSLTVASSLDRLAPCSELGEECNKTLFKRCCQNYVCDLVSPFRGTCIDCYPLDHTCVKNSECCSSYCHLLRCGWRRMQMVS